MRTAHADYVFSKTEIRILRKLSKGKQSLSEIGKTLALKPAWLSQNLKKLQEKGLTQKIVQGNSKLAYFNDAKHALLLKELLVSYNYIDWENIITGKTIEILFHALTPSETDLPKLSKPTIWRNLKNLKARGIITQTNKKYRINPRFSTLEDFLKEYQHFFAIKLTKTISEDSIILWQKDLEFLVRVPKKLKPPSKSFLKTATSKFNEYDLPLISDFDVYFYSTSKGTIRPEDAILHTLLIEPNNVRYTIYALLLLKKTEKEIDKTYFLQEAERLGLKKEVTGMLQFLKNHTQLKDQALPTWQEFVTKARDYNLVIE
jgi:DNA-binding HxlR family transcriptional regulator